MARISLDFELDVPGRADDITHVLDWLIRVTPRAPIETVAWFLGAGPEPTWPVLYELTDVLEAAFPADVVDAVGGVGMTGRVVDRDRDLSSERLWTALHRYRHACQQTLATVADETTSFTAVAGTEFVEVFETSSGGPRSGLRWTSSNSHLHFEPADRDLRAWSVTSNEPFTVRLRRGTGRSLDLSAHDHRRDALLGRGTITTVDGRGVVITVADVDLGPEGSIRRAEARLDPDGSRLRVSVTVDAKPRRRWIGALSNGWFLARRSVRRRVERAGRPRLAAVIDSPQWVEVVRVARQDTRL